MQVGMWLKTLHLALMPHVPRQGSTHLFSEQAIFRGQSEFRTHSGRQPLYGSPKRPDGHVHVHRPLDDFAVALGPQGLGLQTSGLGVTGLSSSI